MKTRTPARRSRTAACAIRLRMLRHGFPLSLLALLAASGLPARAQQMLPEDCDEFNRYELNLQELENEGEDVRRWDGQGVLERWASGINWEGNSAPVTGSHLGFPSNTRLGFETDNNFPSGTEFGSITICNSSDLPVRGWVHHGNRIKLRNWLRIFGGFNTECSIGFPITIVAGSPNLPTVGHEISSRIPATFTEAIDCGPHLVRFGGVFLDGPVSGTGGLIFSRDGRLGAANTFSNHVRVTTDGKWTVHNESGLGTASGGTLVGGDSELHYLPAVCAEPFQLMGGALYFDAVAGTAHTATIELAMQSSEIHSQGPTTFSQPFRRVQTFYPGVGAVVASGIDISPKEVHLHSLGGGSITLSGNVASIPAADAFTGDLYNASGLVRLDVTGGFAAGGAVVASGGKQGNVGTELRWLRSDQVPATVELRSLFRGNINLNGHSQTAARLVVKEGAVNTGAGTLTLTGPLESQSFAAGLPLNPATIAGNLRLASATALEWNVSPAEDTLTMSVNVTLAPGMPTTLRKTGPGQITWSGLASGLQLVDIEDGTLEYGGNAPAVDFRLIATPSGAASFQGLSCSIRDLTASPSGFYVLAFDGGVSTCRNLTLTAPCHMRRILGPGQINDYMTASGTVALGNARISFQASYVEDMISKEYFIVRKTSPGPVTGLLLDETTGQPFTEGQLLTLGPWIYRFSYAGGDGNDVSLKLVSFVPDGIASTWTGAGGNNFWNNGDNWGGSIRTGRTCLFPAVTNRSPVHNFPGGSFVEKIRILADGYSFLGNSAGLLSGIDANYATGQTLFNFPLILAGNQSFRALQSAHLRCGTTSNGGANLNGWTLTLDAAAAGASVELGAAAAGNDPAAAISGSGTVIKRGTGDVILYAPSSFTGLTQVVQGKLKLGRSPLALGATGLSNGTVVNAATTLELAFPGGVFPETVAVNGGTLQISADAGHLITAQGEVQCNGSGGTVTVLTGQLNSSGGVTGSKLTKHGFGTMQIMGSAPFTLSDRVVVDSGPLLLARTAGSNAPVRCDVSGSGAVLRLGAPDQLASLVSVDSAGLLDLNGHNETLPELRLNDAAVTTGTGTLTCPLISTSGLLGSTLSGKLALPAGGTVLDVLNDDPGVDLTLGAAISGGTLTLTGGGTVVLSGNNTFTAAQLNDGKADFNGTNTAAVTLNGGIVAGTGTVGSITSTGGGIVSPGSGIGILSSGNVSLNPSTTFAVDLNGATPGTGHDQLSVTGTVNLGGAALLPLVGTGAAGVMTILSNDGVDAVTGTFAGLPENTVFAVGAKSYRISYVGGTGNDVTLTVVVTGTGVTKTWTGGGANNLWSTPGNWSGGIAPVAGDDLVFPAGPSVKTCGNNFPAFTTFNSLRISDSGYALAGNSIALNAGIVFDYPTGLSTVALDLTLAGAQSFTVLQGAQGVVAPDTAIVTAGFSLTAHVDGAAGRLSLNNMTGTGALVKSGTGGLTMNVNTWTGPVTLTGGETKTGTLSGFGAGTTAIVVNSGAELRFENIASGTFTRPLTLAGKLEISASPITLSGAIALAPGGARTVETDGAGIPILSGVLSGSGGLRKAGTGSLTLSGAAANTFTGGCTVADGTLRLQKSNQVALPGPVTIGDGAGSDALTFLAANQIANAATVNLNGSGAQMQCGTFSDTIGALRFTGGTVSGSGTLTVAERLESFAAPTTATVDINFVPSASPFSISVADGAAAVDLALASDWLGAASLDAERDGAGTLSLRSGTMRTLTLSEGLTLMNGLFDAADVILKGGTMGGTGTTGQVSTDSGKGGGIAPGASPGELTVSRWTGDADTTLTMEIGGTTPAVQHDVLRVRGIADPRSAVLNLVATGGFQPLPGQTFTIVVNEDRDAMPGGFFKLEEGTRFSFAGTTAEISYRGGDGNDVAVTILFINETGVTRVWDGGGADSSWMTPENWEEDAAPLPGDTLLFPGAVPQLSNNNNFPAGTNFHRIIVAGNGVALTGNSISLNAGVSSTQSSLASMGLPITLTSAQTFHASGAGDIRFTPAATVSLNGNILTFAINSAGDLLLENPITGSGGVICDSIGTPEGTGFGSVRFTGVSSYSGPFSLVQGAVHLTHPGTLGTSASVAATGALIVNAAASPVFTQSVSLRGALVAEGGTARYNGTITLPAAAVGRIGGTSTLLAGRIQSAGALQAAMDAGQTLTLTGTLANTFTGGLTVISGAVVLQKPAGITALPGPATIHGDVRHAAANQIADGAEVSITESGSLDLAGFDDTLASLTMTGGSVTTAAGTLTLTGGLATNPSDAPAILLGNIAHTGAGVHEWSIADGAASPDVQGGAHITVPPGVIVRKAGPGLLALTQDLAGALEIAEGEISVSGSSPAALVTLSGGTLSGTGSVGSMLSAGGGTVGPGGVPGILAGESVAWDSDITFAADLLHSTAGSGHDQLAIAGPVNLGGANLSLNLLAGFSAVPGDAFVLVHSDAGGITGSFAGLPEGALVRGDAGVDFSIRYTGSSVVLIRVDPLVAEITGSSLTPGTGAEAGLTVATLTATGTPGLRYHLESSPDLTNWTTEASAPADSGGILQFRTTFPGTTARLFLRIGFE